MINKGVLKVDFIFTFFKTTSSSDKNEFTGSLLNEENVTGEEKNSIENISEINGNDHFLSKPTSVLIDTKSKDILFPIQKNRLISEERRYLVTTGNLENEATLQGKKINNNLKREPVIIVSF